MKLTGRQPTLEALERAECMDLLSSFRHCRVAYCFLGRPHIEVVNFIIDGADVVIRMAVGTRSAAIGAGADLAVEVDRLDGLLRCSIEGDRPHFARITPVHVFGRRISTSTR